MVEAFLVFDSDYILRHEDGTELQSNEQPMRRGSYFVIIDDSTEGSCNQTKLIAGTITVNNWYGVAEFRDAVRQRDRRCVITGERVVSARNSWTGFEATHIFPSAYEGYWKEYNFGHWISIHPSTGGSINSVQNGLLLDSTIHVLFDTYDVSINPDVVCFDTDRKGIAGKYIEFGNDERRPVDQLLRWHFRQAILANMRGAGEPVFECE
ncbi:hypothetical protein EV426DRAFT_627516 [Tirmania nivea]|nr:hypothetical protein EV426DRAFT_627516 [Tirmania nivea]